MTSMLEVLREYKHLAAQKKRDGSLPGPLEARLSELEGLVRAEREKKKAQTPMPSVTPAPRAASRAQRSAPRRAATPAPAAAPAAPRRPKAPAPKSDLGELPLPKPEKASFFADPKRRQQLKWLGVILALILTPTSVLLFGHDMNAVIDSLVPGVLLCGLSGWAVLYPGLMFWREHAAATSTTHLTEPDFVARAPVVEPVVAALTGLGAVSWLILGDLAEQGLVRMTGFMFGMLFGLVSLGGAAILIIRPVFRKKAAARAFGQYYQAGVHNLEKNNTRRARKMFELAHGAAQTPEQAAMAAEKLDTATGKEARDLEDRGYASKAKELRRNTKKAKARPRAQSMSHSSSQSLPVLPAQQTEPRLLTAKMLRKVGANFEDPLSPVREDAEALARRGRRREALEMLIDEDLAIPASLAKEAAEEYIGASLLRSADMIYDAIGERQIPEFYKAVAVEWSRANGGRPPPKHALRIAKMLQDLGDAEAAVRIASQGALSGDSLTDEARDCALLAETMCRDLGADPPPEIVERLGRYAEAAQLYERGSREEDADRVRKMEADRLIAAKAAPREIAPFVSPLFAKDKYLDDKYLVPLVEAILESGKKTSLAIRALSTFRGRHRDDIRVSTRLVEMYVSEGMRDEAIEELGHLEQLSGSSPDVILDAYRKLHRQYVQDTRIASGFARALVRGGKAADATGVVRRLLTAPGRAENAEGLIKLIDGLFEWGRADVELRRERAMLLLDLGDAEAAIADLEQYVNEGGRNPEGLDKAVDLLSTSLVSSTGGPNHEAHLRLARFHLFAGKPTDAIPLLEIATAAPELKQDVHLLLGRAELAASNPRRAIQVLRDAIGGRHPKDAPELHFELARAFETLGDLKSSKKIDEALDRYAPSFVESYLNERPGFDRADTVWMPSQHDGFEDLTAAPDTDVGAAPQVVQAAPEPEVWSADESTRDEVELEDVLKPRYKLIKRVGSGGMGDVHLAEDHALSREVAIKVLRRSLATDLFISKFKDEARIVAQLTHPGIVSVYDIGQRGAWSYIVMEYVAGPNLATLVHATIPPTIPEILDVIAQVAEAMAYAHKRGVIHRDLKPANILVTLEGEAKVTDFGIARVLEGDTDETAFSAAGLQVGTVNYMAPEQIRGQPIDARTDVYLLGTTLYYALCLQYPYKGDAVPVQKIRQDATPLSKYLPQINAKVDEAVNRCLAREPDERFQTMAELAASLRALIDPGDRDQTEIS